MSSSSNDDTHDNSSSKTNEAQDTTNIGQMYGGLLFVKTKDRSKLVQFYKEQIHMKVWLEQPNVTILSHGNFLFGFNQIKDLSESSVAETAGCYTFVYPTKEQVDNMYLKFASTTADGPPRVNTVYQIYQFFAKDPEGRTLEFQAFLHPLAVVTSE
eukprot:CAMPEP_0194224832 /NCGR_PEP_ID=MMETSP0156-20130528/38271_1 /TAXON_ID=33649 /ORGANISM="Thalassionema nitzschioides, Strain L26-B" /LENGTH=155 /DNA_ID=CAMNT_0038956551 /DNA_START=402 /DNA_END=866 /DNA_ORIENTATION=-